MITPEGVRKRALHACGRGTRYKLGAGGMDPKADLPSDNGRCDCSGYASFCLGISRYQPSTLGWVETSRIVDDATGPHRLFRKVTEPRVGDLIVYGDSGGHEGHVGVVTAVKDGQPTYIAHCNGRTSPDAIVNERYTVWWKAAKAKHAAIYARYNGLHVVEEEEEMDRITVRVGATRFVGYRDGEANYIPLAAVKPFLEKHGALFGWDPKAAEVKIDLPK